MFTLFYLRTTVMLCIHLHVVHRVSAGFMVTEHYDYLLGKVLKDMYYYYLTNDEASTKLRIQVSCNSCHG